MNKQNKKLTLKVLLGYGSGDVGGNLYFTVVALLLMNYFTDIVGLPPILAGIAIMLGKVWDAITDPVVGFLSDKTKSTWGRRRPWLLFASVPLGLSMFNLFKNPGINNNNILFIWACLSFIIISTFYTFVNIPYNALTPDLTKDYNERTKLNGVRMFFAVCGTFLGGALAQPIINTFANKNTGYIIMGALFGGVMTLFAIIPFITVKEPEITEAKINKENIFKSYLSAFKNIPFILILIPWTLNIAGITIITGTLVYYFKYLFNNEYLLTNAMLILLGFAMLFNIIITLSSNFLGKIGKKKIYIIGMSIFTLAVLIIFFFGHKLGLTFLYVFIGLAGIGFSTHYVMPWSIIPDTIEYDYLKNGVKKEGIYYGLWTFLTKVGQAFAALLIGIILNVFGYIPNVVQSNKAIFGIRLLIGPITALLFIIANIILAFYPINKKKYEEIQQQIKVMEMNTEL